MILIREFFKGITLMGFLRIFTRLIAFFKIIILARIFSPSEFGIFAIASFVLSLVEVFTETGINIFLIQKGKSIRGYLDSCFLISIIRGLILSTLIVLSSNFVSDFFSSEESKRLILLISIVPLIRGLINPSLIKFQKELKFGKELLIKSQVVLVESITTLGLAIIFRDVISFVWGLIVGSFFEMMISWIFVEPRPKLSFDKFKVKEILTKGKWVTLYGIFNYSFENIDDVAVGRLLNTYSLGLYQMAYKISTLPISEVTDTFAKVSFPYLVKLKKDPKNFKKMYFQIMFFNFILIFPLGVLIYLFPETIIKILVGENWLAITSVLKALSVFAILRATLLGGYSLFLALEKQEYITFLTFISSAFMVVTIVPLILNFGIVGACYSAIIGVILTFIPYFYFIFKIFR